MFSEAKEKLVTLIEKKRRKLGSLGRKRAKKNFFLEKFAQDHKKIYDQTKE